MKVRVHVLVSGLVQGIFFRSATREKAHDLSVNGWVRNTHDGKVEAVFEGERFKVMELVDFCRHGPPGARVDDVKTNNEDFSGEFDSFEVRY